MDARRPLASLCKLQEQVLLDFYDRSANPGACLNLRNGPSLVDNARADYPNSEVVWFLPEAFHDQIHTLLLCQLR
jgi:hypothetical protein